MTVETFLLEPADAPAVAKLLADAREDYVKHFHPFPFTAAALVQCLSERRQDRYWGLRCEGSLAGFWMLRGFDAGFARPAFGVFVAEQFSGRGLARQALQAAIEYCRLRGTPGIVLTVHPENPSALRIYEAAGFRPAPERSHQTVNLYELAL